MIVTRRRLTRGKEGHWSISGEMRFENWQIDKLSSSSKMRAYSLWFKTCPSLKKSWITIDTNWYKRPRQLWLTGVATDKKQDLVTLFSNVSTHFRTQEGLFHIWLHLPFAGWGEVEVRSKRRWQEKEERGKKVKINYFQFWFHVYYGGKNS
jgi:hypothetical protein